MNHKAEGQTMAADSTLSASEPAVTIPRYALNEAISNAERVADDILTKLREAEAQRDDHVRAAGEAQARIDALSTELNRRTRHVRRLLAAAASAESKA